MANEKKKSIESRFTRTIKPKVSKLFSAHRDNKTIDIRQWVIDIVNLNAKRTDWSDYTSGDAFTKWSEAIPQYKEFENGKILEDFIEDHLIFYVCFICSIFEVDHYFSKSDKMRGWLVLYDGSTPVSFFTKMITLMPFSKFEQLPFRKIKDIIIQLEVMMDSINRNIDDEKTQSDIADSIVVSTTVASRIKEKNVLEILSA